MQRVKITSDGTRMGTRIVDVATGEDVKGCYAFEVNGGANKAANSATIFCYADELDVTADAQFVPVPIALKQRAKQIAERFDNPGVTKALSELIGESVRATPASRD